ncbi:MAG: AAA family ATPase [Candidatus Limnocylindrales bacterium]
MPVITIAREYGAGGSSVASLLAQELGADVVDRSLIADVARRASLPPDEVAAEDEQGRTVLDRLARLFVPFGEAAAGWAVDPTDLLDHHVVIVDFTRAALREAARSRNAVIVGRGGAEELRDQPDACHVFLWAPERDRIRSIQERLGCDEATARREIHSVDARRAAYIREVHGVDWHDRALYDMVINTARLGYAGAAAAILGVIRSRHAPGVQASSASGPAR